MTRNTRARTAAASRPNPTVNLSTEIPPPRKHGKVQFQDVGVIRTCDTIQEDMKQLLTAMQNRFEHERYLTRVEAEAKRMEKKIHELDAQINRLFQSITSVRAPPPQGVSAEVL